MEQDGALPSTTLWLDGAGEVFPSLLPDELSWKLVDSENSDTDAFACLCVDLHAKEKAWMIHFSTVYSVELIELGNIHKSAWNLRWLNSGRSPEMHRFMIHSYCKSEVCHTPWVLLSYTFGHKDLQACQMWVDQLNTFVRMQTQRPKNLLVFVHPLCGKGNGIKTWEMVSPIFSRARVKTKVVVTNRAGHAFDTIQSSSDKELVNFDGIVAVGGDGLFNEILNGLLSSRYKQPYPIISGETNSIESLNRNPGEGNDKSSTGSSVNGSFVEISCKNDDQEPLLSTTSDPSACIMNSYQGHVLSFPNDWFRIGIIPSGSTDAIVISTTGMRDPVTSALQIVLGKKMPLDIAQVVRWKAQPSSMQVPYVRYAASFAGYGFYGDVIRESEKYRWMGPKRYDFAGTKMFLKHRSYEAEVAFLKNKSIEKPIDTDDTDRNSCRKPRKRVCLVNCTVCNETNSSSSAPIGRTLTSPSTSSNTSSCSKDVRWVRLKGHYLSVGAAVIPCRNERAPDGLVADAHLADGFLHLILIKDCPRPFYLWHLIQLTRKGSEPLNYRFVEHHKTTAFTFTSLHDESVWNLDGELLQASQVSVQACRGLVNLFASGPEI